MKAVIQRVRKSKVEIDDEVKGEIGTGLNVLVGVGQDDTEEDANWLAAKIATLRIFNDKDGLMNLSVNEVRGDVLAISQFTLHAKTKKGTRPSYIRAAKPDLAVPLYEHFLKVLQHEVFGRVESGIFGADMKVMIENDGPVTILIDTKNKD
ncbi:D-aminoacyl-tRNA deacylase [Cryomorphaceae bacterium 1068]|nr:D-aminoacyl-tRNA deacylase [Cryomorphaceae bacterium 1068]